MKEITETRIEYEQKDFDDVEENMTLQTVIEILEILLNSYSDYKFPSRNGSVSIHEYNKYTFFCAIYKCIETLKARENQ